MSITIIMEGVKSSSVRIYKYPIYVTILARVFPQTFDHRLTYPVFLRLFYR